MAIIDRVFEELGVDIKKLIEEHCPKYEEYKDWGQEDFDELDDFDDIERLLTETGCEICEDKGGKLRLGECIKPDKAAGCNIPISCSKKGWRKVGSFHTHPLVGDYPSAPDINCSLDEQVFCIGSRLKDDRPHLSCYIPVMDKNRQALMGVTLMNPFKRMYDFKIQPGGSIRFWRGQPEATVDDILEILTDGDLGIYHESYKSHMSEKEVKKLGAMVRKDIEKTGEMPERYWDFYEGSNEGEWDELDFYLPEQGEELMKQAHEILSPWFFIKSGYL